MRRTLAFLPLAVLFIANVVPSKAQTSDASTATTISVETTTLKTIPERPPDVEGSDVPPGAIQYYDISRKNATLTCSLNNPTGLAVVWEKNNTKVSDVKELAGRHKTEVGGTVLVIQKTVEEDYGNYSCMVGEARQYWQLHARPIAKLPSTDTSVVEAQKLKLVCKLSGKPAVPVDWWYNKDHTSSDDEGMDLGVKLESGPGSRVTLGPSDAGVENGELVIAEAARADAGAYSCVPRAPEDARAPHATAYTVLRVKDMYAALWPFLGICAEVLVLCAIILVYEKRRTKPEMDDSDTDNHDQKKS